MRQMWNHQTGYIMETKGNQNTHRLQKVPSHVMATDTCFLKQSRTIRYRLAVGHCDK